MALATELHDGHHGPIEPARIGEVGFDPGKEVAMIAAPFLDKTRPPSRPELFAALGTAGERWDRLESWARDTYGIAGEPIYFGKDTSWSLRFRRGGRALFTLMPGDGALAALVVVGPSAWADATTVELSPHTRAAWDAAHPYPDGRWLWLDVNDDQAIADVQRLVTLKSPPPRRVRAPRTSQARVSGDG
jgi:hypothetical protein